MICLISDAKCFINPYNNIVWNLPSNVWLTSYGIYMLNTYSFELVALFRAGSSLKICCYSLKELESAVLLT